MIAFDLQCDLNHQFEGWFGSNDDFEKQLAQGLVVCPICGSQHVRKRLSAPNIGRKGNQLENPVPHAVKTGVPNNNDDTAVVSNSPQMPAPMREMIGKLAEAQSEALEKSEWVGREFAEEARAIHYGETEDRVIHGEATPQEADSLAEEGIAATPLLFPYVPPQAKN